MRYRNWLFFAGFIFSLTGWGQAPVIYSIQPISAGPNQQFTINGSGFSSTSSQLNVWFDHVKGTILSSTPFSIQVQVPAQARFSNVEVVNLSNNLSGKSSLKFFPSFGGEPFSETKLSAVYTNTDAVELFDVAGSDLDLDGKPDLVVTRTKAPASDLLIYKNSSTGIGNINFTKIDKTVLTSLNVGVPTANVTCADLNGDSKPDIITSPPEGNYGSKFLILKNTNSVAGTMSFAASIPVFLDAGQFASHIVVRDLNADGKPEIIVSNSNDSGTDNQIYIYPNQSTVSTISFGAFIKLTVTGAKKTYGLDVQDIDGDSRPEIILTQFQANNVFIFRNSSNGAISFSPVQVITTTGRFLNITTSDFNNDGLLDLVATAPLDNNIQILINKSSVSNINFDAPIVLNTSTDGTLSPPTNGGPWGIDVADMDGDGDLDIAVDNIYYARLNIFRQDAALSFTKLDFTLSKPGRNVRLGDYDGDGKPDIATTTLFGFQYSLDVIRNANCVSPVITGLSNSICSGQTIRLSTKPALGVTFTWQKDGTTVQTSAQEYYDATAAGTYTVTAAGTFDTSCSIISPNYVLTSGTGSAPSTAPTINYNTACVGGSLTLSTPTVSGATYTWTGPNNFSSAVQNPPAITPVTAAVAGTYTLLVKVGVCSSPLASQQVDVAFVPVLPVTSSPASTVCAGASVTLSVSGSGYTYQWKKAGSAISGQTGSSLVLSSVSSADESDYSVVVTSGSTLCSQETAKTSIQVYSPPTANFTVSSPSCVGTVTTFTDQSNGDSRGTLSYAWAFGDGNTSSSQSPTHTYATVNSYSPTLTVSYIGVSGCASTPASKSISVINAVVPSIQSSANPICNGDATTLSISGTYNLISWSGDNSLSGSALTAAITKPGGYTVNTTDANGCVATASITIDAKPLIDPFVVGVDKSSIKLGDKVQLSATTGADSYSWTPATSVDNATIANPIGTPAANTTYKVVAKKSGYCDAVDSVKVTVDTGGGASINAPVMFTPNGDTFNDTWKIPDTDSYPDCTMTIYDGHGSQVYQQKPYNMNNYWDGSSGGKAVPDGTYFYVFSCPSLKPATGNVLIVR